MRGCAHLAAVGTLVGKDFVSEKRQEAHSSKLLTLAKRWTSLESKRSNYFDLRRVYGGLVYTDESLRRTGQCVC